MRRIRYSLGAPILHVSRIHHVNPAARPRLAVLAVLLVLA